MKIISPLVSVIIINWNGGEVFENCLKSLAKINYSNWELIIVDNASEDGSQYLPSKILQKNIRIRLIQNSENVGFASANNQALSKIKGKYILLLNNDTKVLPDLFSKAISRMEKDSSIGILQPKILMMDKKGYLDNAGSFMTRIGFLDHWGFGEKDGKGYENEKEIFSAKGACMFIKREIVQDIGLFDNSFVSYFEESDFCWRVWLAGYKVIFYPETNIYHKVGFTIKRLNVLNINYHYYKNRIRSLVKNLDLLNLFIILPAHLVVSLGIAGVFLFRRQPRNAFLIFKAILWNIINIRATLKERKIVQSKRKITDKDLFVNLMRPIKWKKYWGDFKRVEKDIKN